MLHDSNFHTAVERVIQEPVPYFSQFLCTTPPPPPPPTLTHTKTWPPTRDNQTEPTTDTTEETQGERWLTGRDMADGETSDTATKTHKETWKADTDRDETMAEAVSEPTGFSDPSMQVTDGGIVREICEGTSKPVMEDRGEFGGSGERLKEIEEEEEIIVDEDKNTSVVEAIIKRYTYTFNTINSNNVLCIYMYMYTYLLRHTQCM